MRLSRGRNLFYFIVTTLVLILSLVLMVVFFFKLPEREPEDPHAGQVYLYDGKDWTWMTPLEGVPVNTLTAEKFASKGRVRYFGSEYDALTLDLPDEPMRQLTVGGEPMALTLVLVSAQESGAPVGVNQPFTATLRHWDDASEDSGDNTLVLDAEIDADLGDVRV